MYAGSGKIDGRLSSNLARFARLYWRTQVKFIE